MTTESRSANPVACPKCKTATILHPVVAESTGFVQPYRLRRCPTCDWQQYENISRAEQAEAMRDRAVPPTDRMIPESLVREFIGYLSAVVPELHNVEVPLLAKRWNDCKVAWGERLAPEPSEQFCEMEQEGETHDLKPGVVCVQCWNKATARQPPEPRAEPEALQVLRKLFEVTDLGDYIYDVREREGMGWDGPKVTQWGQAVQAAKNLMRVTPTKDGQHG